MSGAMTQNIDLTRVAGSGTVHNLTGRERGEAARRALELDWWDGQPGRAVVHVPDFLLAVTESFVVGLFSESVERLGLLGFYEKYSFDAKPALLHQLHRAIERIAAPRQKLLPDAA
jgi:uncharacterized protein YbjT (DUF2867 family)